MEENQKRGRGRPLSETELRTERLVFYTTPATASHIKRTAQLLEMKSASQFICAIMERLAHGDYTPLTFARLGFQISRLAASKTNGKQEIAWDQLFDILEPLPPIEDDGLQPEEIQQAINELEQMKKEITKC